MTEDRDPTPEPVLVADDNAANRLLVVRQLERLGRRAEAVADGDEALRAIADRPYALVLMDCQMPGLDGVSATRSVRERERSNGRRTPIVGITAGATEGIRDRCVSAGMDEVLTKPLLLEDLAAVLDRWSPAPRSAVSSRGPAAEAPAAPAGGVDRDALRRLVDDLGPESAARFVSIYLEELPGRRADLAAAFASRDAGAVGRTAHILRAPSASIGARALASLCGEADRAAAAGRVDGAAGEAIDREAGVVETELRRWIDAGDQPGERKR